MLAVSEFSQLSFEQDKELKDAVLLANKIFNTPIAIISLLDEEKLGIKLSVGLSQISIPTAISLCNYTASLKEILIIEDTLKDQHFSELSIIEGGKEIRFYAAAPLITKHGLCVGTLSVLDFVTHSRVERDELCLSILAKHVISVMEAKLNLDKLDYSFSELDKAKEIAIKNEIKLRALFESLTDVYVFLGMSGEILDFNQAAYDYIFKFKGKKMVRGGYTAHYLNHVDNLAFMTNFKSALNGQRVSQEMLSNPELAERVWWDSIFEPVRDINGEMMGVSYTARNINKRKIDSEKILNQNKILKQIAHIHAHEYRGPVCAILGIMNLIEGDNFETTKESLLMLKKAVNNLDLKTHKIINLISDLNQVTETGNLQVENSMKNNK